MHYTLFGPLFLPLGLPALRRRAAVPPQPRIPLSPCSNHHTSSVVLNNPLIRRPAQHSFPTPLCQRIYCTISGDFSGIIELGEILATFALKGRIRSRLRGIIAFASML